MARKRSKKRTNEMRVLIAWKGQLFPFSIIKTISKRTLALSEESNGSGDFGEFFGAILVEAQQALHATTKACRKGEGKNLVRWGFKIVPVKEEEGHTLYKIEDDPLGD